MNVVDRYLQEIKMLDYSNKKIQHLISERMWKNFDEFECLKSIYNFVRDEIFFGYNVEMTSLHQRSWQMVMDNVIQKGHCLWHC